MTGADAALLSPNWYRVAALRPRLREHVRILRHVYRGEVWHVVEDRVGGRHLRLNRQAHRLVCALDGRRDLQSLWSLLTRSIDSETPTQDELIRLVGQLHAQDMIRCDIGPDQAELFERAGRERRRKWLGRYANPLSIRLRLFDPDRLLGRVVDALHSVLPPGARSWIGAALAGTWLAVLGLAVAVASSHWNELAGGFGDRLLAGDNLLVMALVFPLLKALHEFAHGLAVKARGGEVHEMGLMLLVLFPVPYVDASDASAFPSRSARLLVGAAGMLAEIFVGALALLLWSLLEPGFARSLAYNTVVLATVTTLLFNANPLLRYDGYYMLADALELPNLQQRANRLWGRWAQRRLFGMRAEPEPTGSASERALLVAYAPLSFAYRLAVGIGIALFVATEYFFFGVLLAIWSLASSMLLPALRAVRALTASPHYARRRGRVRGVLGGAAALLALVFFTVPVPHHTLAEAVVWMPEQALVRARTNLFVDSLAATPGADMVPGALVARGSNPSVLAALAQREARLEEARGRWDAQRGVNPARADQLLEEVRREEAELAHALEEAQRLAIVSGAAGALLLDRPADLPGRFLGKGEVLGYVVGEFTPLVRTVVPQSDVDRVRGALRAVEVRFPQQPSRSFPARVSAEVPGAGRELPSPALSTAGGGSIVADPRDEAGRSALESYFQFELTLGEAGFVPFIGSRAWVRFEHPPEPVAYRIGRALRRLFLTRFGW